MAQSADSEAVFQYENGRTPLKVPGKRGRPKGSAKRLPQDVPPSQDLFDFVHMDGRSKVIDIESRKTIRRRVMINHIDLKRKQQSKQTQRLFSPSSQIGGVYSLGPLPIACEPYMLDLLRFYITIGWKKFYPIEKLTCFNPVTDYWLSLALTDDAFLHIILGCADSHFAPFGMCGRPRTLKHLNAAISIVTRRIESDKYPSEATLVVVATMAMLEKNRGAHLNWDIHMKGLSKLIALRGGFSTLESMPLVLTKLYRADLLGSIDALQIPYFSSCWTPSPLRPSCKPINEGFGALDSVVPLEKALVSCIQALTDIVDDFQSLNMTSRHADVATIRYWVTATQYTLLSNNYLDPAQELCRLGLMLLSEIFINEDMGQIPVYENLVLKVWRLISEDSVKFVALPDEFKMWILFLAEAATTSHLLAGSCGKILAETAISLNIFTWNDAKTVLQRVLWSSTFEDKRFEALWNDTIRSWEAICP